MNLFQHRGSAFGGWAAGLLLHEPSEACPWKFEFHRSDSHWDLDVRTPVGGFFTWIRFW